MNVALKFCGGCDPAYDRVEYWEKIRQEIDDKINWVKLDTGRYDAVLLICGCNSACPRKDVPQPDCMVVLSDDSLKAESVFALLEACLNVKNGDESEHYEKGVSRSWISKQQKTTSGA